jgi:hypothetical protein
MESTGYLSTYTQYLIHPFRSHELLLEENESIKNISLSESIGLSWIFVVLNGVVRILLINFVLILFMNLFSDESTLSRVFESDDGFIGFYFLIFSTILDVIFYPLFMLFFVQFWSFILRIFGSLLNIEDTDERVEKIMVVTMSSQILSVIPIFGGIAQKFAALILMFAGIKKQLEASTLLTLCILSFPLLLMLGIFSLVMTAYAVSLIG